jgi:hypothetical protein
MNIWAYGLKAFALTANNNNIPHLVKLAWSAKK